MLTQYLANGQGVVEVCGVVAEVVAQSQTLPPLMHKWIEDFYGIEKWLV